MMRTTGPCSPNMRKKLRRGVDASSAVTDNARHSVTERIALLLPKCVCPPHHCSESLLWNPT